MTDKVDEIQDEQQDRAREIIEQENDSFQTHISDMRLHYWQQRVIELRLQLDTVESRYMKALSYIDELQASINELRGPEFDPDLLCQMQESEVDEPETKEDV